MSKWMVPFARLVLCHREIGLHRDRRWGFRDVFGFRTLYDRPFLDLATRVKRAYEGADVPSHDGWPAQREALRWLVNKGREGIYEIDPKGIRVKSKAQGVVGAHRAGATVRIAPLQRYYIADGNHRALALYILGDSEVRARI